MAEIKPSFGRFKSFSDAMGASKAARKAVDRVARANSLAGAVFKADVDKSKALRTKARSKRTK